MTTTKSRWVRSEDAGHGAGAMLLDAPVGHWSVRRANGRRWVAALVKGGVAVWSREFQTRREAMEFAEADVAAGRRWPTIRNCNFAARHDDRGRHVHEALLAADRGCEDCDLIGALDDLESTLADHAEDGSEESMRLCREAEEAVEAAFLTPVARHEERPVEGIGWYVYVGGQDAGGPFETEADALAHWQK